MESEQKQKTYLNFDQFVRANRTTDWINEEAEKDLFAYKEKTAIIHNLKFDRVLTLIYDFNEEKTYLTLGGNRVILICEEEFQETLNHALEYYENASIEDNKIRAELRSQCNDFEKYCVLFSKTADSFHLFQNDYDFVAFVKIGSLYFTRNL